MCKCGFNCTMRQCACALILTTLKIKISHSNGSLFKPFFEIFGILNYGKKIFKYLKIAKYCKIF